MEVELFGDRTILLDQRLVGSGTAALRRCRHLKPRVVDPRTSYCRYHPDQVGDTRLICSLRGVDLPIDEICQVLTSDSDVETPASCFDTSDVSPSGPYDSAVSR